jgi:hypothetical protein
VLLDLSARAFHDMSVLNPGWTSSLAGETAKTPIDVCYERFVDRKASIIDLQDLVNSATRRIGFKSEHPVRRTMVQAQAAVDANRVERPVWAVLL